MTLRFALVSLALALASVAHAEPPPAPSAYPPPYVTPPTTAPLQVGRPVPPNAIVQPRLPLPHDPSPPRAGHVEGRLAVGIGAGLMWRAEPAQRVFTDRAFTPGVEVFARYDLWSPLPRTFLAAGASLRSEQLGEDRFGVRHHAAQAELAARYGVTSWLWPELRLGLGMVHSRFRLAALRSDDLDYTGRDTHVLGSVGGGVTLRTPARLFETQRGRLSALSLGLLLDGGYAFARSATLTAEADGAATVARTGFALGDLKRSGAYFRMVMVVRL